MTETDEPGTVSFGEITADSVDLSAFTGWPTFAELPDADVPTDPGVYVVVRPTVTSPKFLDVSPAGWFKGKDPTIPVAELKALWVPGARTVYVGKANLGSNGRRGLRKRLDEFRRFGSGEAIGHSGGRRIWQLADYADLLIGWRVTDDADARPTERTLIAAFRGRHGMRPSANMTG
jgi:hypothetical protein